MKKPWLLTLSLTLLLALGCGKDEEGDGAENSSDSADSGDASGGGGNPNGEPNAGQGGPGPDSGGPDMGDMGDGEDTTSPGDDGIPNGGDPNGGVASKPKQPSFAPNLPVGKQRVWTYGTGGMDIRLYVNKTATVIAKAFGQPKSHNKLANNNVVYTYDKMRVRAANKEYSTMLVTIQPLPKGGTRVTNITLDPKSAKEVAAASGRVLTGAILEDNPEDKDNPEVLKERKKVFLPKAAPAANKE